MEPSPRRLRENEELMESINERIDARTEQIREEDGLDTDAPVAFFCECSDLACTERIEIEPQPYRAIHEDPEQFVVLPGHEIPEVERIVDQRPGYLIVRKLV